MFLPLDVGDARVPSAMVDFATTVWKAHWKLLQDGFKMFLLLFPLVAFV